MNHIPGVHSVLFILLLTHRATFSHLLFASKHYQWGIKLSQSIIVRCYGLPIFPTRALELV